jgi:hypothetical protein
VRQEGGEGINRGKRWLGYRDEEFDGTECFVFFIFNKIMFYLYIYFYISKIIFLN